MPNAHSSIGASSCERWWNCPGSVALVATVPPQPPSEYAKEGTAAHALASMVLEKGERDVFLYVGQEIQGFEVTPEMAECVQIYVETIYEDVIKHDLGLDDLEIEHRFHLKGIHEGAFGTNDANLREFMGRLIVYDYKHGAGIAVDAQENKQGLYYALGAAAEGDYTTIEIVIVQPRAQHKDGPVRRWTITKQELDAFGQELKNKIAQTESASAPLKPGVWCKKTFCPAMSSCPALRKNIENAAMTAFAEADKITLPAADSLTPLELRRLLDAIPLIDAWIKSVEGHAMAIAMRGEKVLDYKLVRKRANRKWSNDAESILKTKFSDEEIFTKKLLSPAQLEKILGKKVVEPLIVKPDAGLVLVHRDDPREEVKPDPSSAFIEADGELFN